jgi:hypothetical protein
MKKIYFLLFIFIAVKVNAQKIESIHFNLYTDSLKKGVHNYINVDGKMASNRFMPLDTKQIIFSSSYGKWEGNSLIIDPAYKKDSVVVTAMLKDDASVTKTITIYMKKNLFQGKLKTEAEILNDYSAPKKKKN